MNDPLKKCPDLRLATWLPRAGQWVAWLNCWALGWLLLGPGCALAKDPVSDSPPGAVATGHYRNLFVEAGHSPEQVTAKLNAAWQQLFHGDPANEAVYFAVGTNQNGALAYIRDIADHDVRTEGISYGMMISVQMNQQAEFDALWNWARTYMYHAATNHPAYGYFSWSMQTNGVALDEMPAPDGEEYFVTALFFAAARWGNGTGIFNYQAEAQRILHDLKDRPVAAGSTNTESAVVELFQPDRKMVRFTPRRPHTEYTDPSYHLPAFYEIWARRSTGANAAFWLDAATASRDFFAHAAHPVTALTPEYAHFDGSPWAAPWKAESVDFRFDAWRSAMNWSVDWSWWAKDTRARERSDRLLTFFAGQGITNYVNQYTLDGQKLGHSHSPGLVAMNAVAALAATNPQAKEFVEAFWAEPVPAGRYRYYDGLLYMMALLHVSGEFRAWEPH